MIPSCGSLDVVVHARCAHLVVPASDLVTTHMDADAMDPENRISGHYDPGTVAQWAVV